MLLAAGENATGSSFNELAPIDDSKTEKWEACRIRHSNYRNKLGLGHERNLTSWKESGYKLDPDFWAPWKGFRERIRDVLEVSHLRSIVRGFDDRYYRYAELF